jgi:hypothetical protein
VASKKSSVAAKKKPGRVATGGKSNARKKSASPGSSHGVAATKKPAVKPSAAAQRAAVIAARIPLVHFPSNDDFENWADGPRRWTALESKAARGASFPDTPFGKLRGLHVFAYAGPSCYFRRDCAGNSLLYFEASAPDGKQGGALPFDSGSLEDAPPRLQPWRSRGATADDCWKVVEHHRKDLAGFREDFERWLVASYDAPDRYLEATPDRYAAGQPDRLDPPELLEHNGVKGRALYSGNCADRRAWTWELHIAGELSWKAVRAVHVPFSLLRLATAWARQVESVHGTRPDVRTLPRDETADFNTLYAASGAVLQEMVA